MEDLSYRDLAYIAREARRANDEVSRLIGTVQRTYAELSRLLLFLQSNPTLAAAIAALSLGLTFYEAYQRMVAEQEDYRARRAQALEDFGVTE